jgi:hypothetical protein
LHPEVADQKFNELDLLLSSIQKADFIGEVGTEADNDFETAPVNN